MKKFLNSNEPLFRLLRTIFQGVIGVLLANIDLLIEPLNISAPYKALIVALVMAIMSPIMASIGGDIDDNDGIEG